MKNYSANYLAHLRGPLVTTAICWRLVKKNGQTILGTDHDTDIRIDAMNIGQSAPTGFDLVGVYKARSGIRASDIRSNSNMSVDNMEVQGSIEREPDLYIDVSIADLQAGLYDGAEVTTFRVNWQDPSDFQDILRHGYFGEVFRTAEGEYRIEVRGLAQVLQQNIVRTAGETCDVLEFGDSRCKFDVASRTVTGVVTAGTSRKRFSATLSALVPPAANGYFNLGKLTMTTGDNAGYIRQVMNDAVGGTLGEIQLWEAMPVDIDVGDEFTLAPGCDRKYLTCRDTHDNLVNFRGPAFFAPGMDQIIRAP